MEHDSWLEALIVLVVYTFVWFIIAFIVASVIFLPEYPAW